MSDRVHAWCVAALSAYLCAAMIYDPSIVSPISLVMLTITALAGGAALAKGRG